MLKIRLLGTLDSIAWFCEILGNHSEIDILEVSEVYKKKRKEPIFESLH